MSYSFGISSELIWSIHIIIGLLFIWIGAKILDITEVRMGDYVVDNSIILHIGSAVQTMGFTMAAYHTHIWHYYRFGEGAK